MAKLLEIASAIVILGLLIVALFAGALTERGDMIEFLEPIGVVILVLFLIAIFVETLREQ